MVLASALRVRTSFAARAGIRALSTGKMSVEETIRSKLTGAFQPSHLYIRNECVRYTGRR